MLGLDPISKNRMRRLRLGAIPKRCDVFAILWRKGLQARDGLVQTREGRESRPQFVYGANHHSKFTIYRSPDAILRPVFDR